MPSTGFLKAMKRLTKPGTSFSPDTAPLIVSIPNMSVAKPRSIVPESFFFVSAQNI